MRFHHQLSVWAQYVVFYQDRGEKEEEEEEKGLLRKDSNDQHRAQVLLHLKTVRRYLLQNKPEKVRIS